MIQILVLLGMYFDAVVVEVKTFLLLFRLALVILCRVMVPVLIWKKSEPKVFNWSDFHFLYVTFYKIHILIVFEFSLTPNNSFPGTYVVQFRIRMPESKLAFLYRNTADANVTPATIVVRTVPW